MPDSSAPGFLTPTGAPVPYDDALDDSLHDINSLLSEINSTSGSMDAWSR